VLLIVKASVVDVDSESCYQESVAGQSCIDLTPDADSVHDRCGRQSCHGSALVSGLDSLRA
jgi:hypothetical protein